MGMFKDIRTLKKQANEMSKNFDSKATLSNGLERMRAAQDMMAQQTEAANLAANLPMTGADATAVIAGVAQTGMMINYQPALQIDLTVMPDGLPPYPATVTQVVEQIFLAKAVAGRSVPIRVDPENPGAIWINWAAA